jgi:hypothetical protein
MLRRTEDGKIEVAQVIGIGIGIGIRTGLGWAILGEEREAGLDAVVMRRGRRTRTRGASASVSMGAVADGMSLISEGEGATGRTSCSVLHEQNPIGREVHI